MKVKKGKKVVIRNNQGEDLDMGVVEDIITENVTPALGSPYPTTKASCQFLPRRA